MRRRKSETIKHEILPKKGVETKANRVLSLNTPEALFLIFVGVKLIEAMQNLVWT